MRQNLNSTTTSVTDNLLTLMRDGEPTRIVFKKQINEGNNEGKSCDANVTRVGKWFSRLELNRDV